jgi:archaellin
MPFRLGLQALHLAFAMIRPLIRVVRSGEAGVAGAEIALLSVALSGGVFATAIVGNGTLSVDRFNEVMHRGLERVSGAMEVRGAVVVTATGAPLHSDTIQLTLGTFGTLPPIALNPSQEGALVISYRDSDAIAQNVPYTARFGQASNGDNNLDAGELVTIVIKVSDLEQIAGRPVLALGKRWTLDLQTPQGASLEFTRTQPSILQPMMAQP